MQQLTTILLLITIASGAFAQPYAYSVNSRSNLEDEQADNLWRLNLSTGRGNRIGPTRFADMEGLAFTPDGVLYGAPDQDKTLVTINLESAFSSPVGNVFFNMGVPLAPLDFGMTSTCEGDLLVVSAIEESLFYASRETGELQRIGELGSLGAPIIGLAAWGGQVFGLGQGLKRDTNDRLIAASPNLYSIDVETATATLIGPLGSEAAAYANGGLDFDEEGVLWALTDRRENGVIDIPSEILRINPETGTAEKVADTELVGFESLAITSPGGCDNRGGQPGDAVIVPVDNRVAMTLLGLLMLAAAGRALPLRMRRKPVE